MPTKSQIAETLRTVADALDTEVMLTKLDTASLIAALEAAAEYVDPEMVADCIAQIKDDAYTFDAIAMLGEIADELEA